MKPVGRRPPKTIVSNQKELSFSKALTDNDRLSKQLNKTPGSGRAVCSRPETAKHWFIDCRRTVRV